MASPSYSLFPSPDNIRSQIKNLKSTTDQAPFVAFLFNLYSSDASIRYSAEPLYDSLCSESPDFLARRLGSLVKSCPRSDTRHFSALLLRRLITSKIIPQHLTSFCFNELKANLIHRLNIEDIPESLYPLCSTVSALAVDLLPRNQWPELRVFVLRSMNSSIIPHNLFAFLLFAEMRTMRGLSVNGYALDEACPYPSPILRVRVAAVRAAVVLIVESSRQDFNTLLCHMLKTLVNLMKEKEYLLAQKVLEEMIVLARARTGVFKTCIEKFIQSMFLMINHDGIEERMEELVIEFVITVAEDRNHGCVMIEELGNCYIAKFLDNLMKMLGFIEDDKAWHEADSDDFNAGESRKFFYGMERLGRLAAALRGNAIVPNYLEIFSNFSVDFDWKKRHAAVTSLMLISGGPSKVLKEHLGHLVEKIIRLSEDAHPRVRWAAINSIGKFSKDLAPELQQQFHQQLVPTLTAAMDDFQNPRVQAQAASAMLFFSQNCMADILKPYLEEIVSKLLEVLQKGKRMLKEGASGALASIASSMQEYFEEYYESVLPHLLASDQLIVKRSSETRRRFQWALLSDYIIGPESEDSIDNSNQKVKDTIDNSNQENADQDVKDAVVGEDKPVFLFEMQLQNSNALVIPIEQAPNSFPQLPAYNGGCNVEEMLLITDNNDGEWEMPLAYYKEEHAFIIKDEWISFLDENNMQAEDIIRFYKPAQPLSANHYLIQYVGWPGWSSYKAEIPEIKRANFLFEMEWNGHIEILWLPSREVDLYFPAIKMVVPKSTSKNELVKFTHVGGMNWYFKVARISADWYEIDDFFVFACWHELLGEKAVIKFYTPVNPSHAKHFIIEPVKMEAASSRSTLNKDMQEDDENALLQQALAMSMDEPAAMLAMTDSDMSEAAEDNQDLALALQLFVQDSANDQESQTDMSKLLGDQSFASSILASLPGVDPNDPSVKDLLASMQNQPSNKKDDDKAPKEEDKT